MPYREISGFIRGAVAALFIMVLTVLVVQQAVAQSPTTVSFSGTIQPNQIDTAGFFGPAGANIGGDQYTVGVSYISADYLTGNWQGYTCAVYCSPVSGSMTITLTVNGATQSVTSCEANSDIGFSSFVNFTTMKNYNQFFLYSDPSVCTSQFNYFLIGYPTSGNSTLTNPTGPVPTINKGTSGVVFALGTNSAYEYFSANYSASVSISSENIATNSIVVNLSPTYLSGKLTVTAEGKAVSQVVYSSNSMGGTVNITYGETTNPLPPGHYTSLKAVWNVDGKNYVGEKSILFTALGLYENTVYNFPHESSCVGTAEAVSLWHIKGSNCISKASTYLSGFISQTNLNGTGVPLIGNYTAPEQFCASIGTNFRWPYTPHPTCKGQTLSNSTIAVNFTTSAQFKCGDQVLFVGEQPEYGNIGTIKTVSDTCPGCNTVNGEQAGHVDNFTTAPDCTNIPSLPDYQAIIVGK